jgi:hypothetical protein
MISDVPGCKEILSSHIIRAIMMRQSILKEANPNSSPVVKLTPERLSKLPKYLRFLWTEK